MSDVFVRVNQCYIVAIAAGILNQNNIRAYYVVGKTIVRMYILNVYINYFDVLSPPLLFKQQLRR